MKQIEQEMYQDERGAVFMKQLEFKGFLRKEKGGTIHKSISVLPFRNQAVHRAALAVSGLLRPDGRWKGASRTKPVP
jgi:hypothetical protein